MLYDLAQCPHRPAMDLYGDSTKRDAVNPFVKLLWEKGTSHEQEVIEGLEVPILDLSTHAGEEKERRTLRAMRQREPMIYGARLSADDLLGEPDLLRREEGGYVAGDIKSGSGLEGDGDAAKPKKHYGVQLALYTDILERRGLAGSRRPFVWDIHGEEVTYDLERALGKRSPETMWDEYERVLAQARRIVARTERTTPAYSSKTCTLCHWYSACLNDLEKADDLTLLPEVGRAKRDAMIDRISTVSELAAANVEEFVSGKKTAFRGIGAKTLRRYHERAKLAKTEGVHPYLTAPLNLPDSERELFFDVENDPMRDFCYLHGFVERHGRDSATERYVAFFTEAVSDEEEERAFAEAWRYIGESQPCVVYYYSQYEHTIWRKLQRKFPAVCTAEEIENLFQPGQSVDLYRDVVRKATEWPTRDYSIKTLAAFLGFKWRDRHPSGAASIEWFDHWIRTGDCAVRQRILDYNEDDCRATRVLLDGIRALKPRQ